MSRRWIAPLCALVVSAASAGDAAPAAPLDVVFALDTSSSAIAPSGADIDGDGRASIQRYFLGFVPIRPAKGDAVLAAELRAVREALQRFDAQTTRVGVIGYAGDAADPGKRGADVLAPLTRDYATVRAALDTLARRGPGGMTDLSGGIDRAAAELGAVEGDPTGTRRVIVLLSDGRPTLPYRGEPTTNRSESVAAAQRASRSGVRILVYGLGPEPFEPLLRQIADAARGEYVRVANPARIELPAELLAARDAPAAP